MTIALTGILDAILGRGESAITVPALDGALRPNRKLDAAVERIAIDRPSGLIARPEGLLASSANEIRRLDPGVAWTPVYKAETTISCLGEAGEGVAIGLENGAVEIIGGRFNG